MKRKKTDANIDNGEVKTDLASVETAEEASAETEAAAATAAPLPSAGNAEEPHPEIPANDAPAKEQTGVVVNGKVLTKAQHNKRTALRWTFITFGAFLMSLSVYFFQVPNNFTLGGVGGISIVLSKYITPLNSFTQRFLTQAVIMAIINVLLLIIGFIVLGKQCTVRTIYCSLLYTGLIWVFEYVDIIGLITGVPTPKGGTPIPLTTQFDSAGNAILGSGQPFLELCFSILLFGIGGALIFNCGASSGGTDIIALITKKYTKLNVGVALMIVDLIIIVISIFTFKDISTALYSFLGLFARTFLLDGVIESFGKTKYLTIITKHPEDIGEYILNVVNHSYTMYDAEGGYTHEKKKVLVTVCKRNEALKIKLKVKQYDPEAFVIITDANEILGKGFGGTF